MSSSAAAAAAMESGTLRHTDQEHSDRPAMMAFTILCTDSGPKVQNISLAISGVFMWEVCQQKRPWLAGWCVRGPAVIAGKGCLIDFQTPNFPPHQAAAAAAVCAE